MEAAIYCLSYAGFVLLCVCAQGPHRPLVAVRPDAGRGRLITLAGWLLLAGAFAAAVARQGWGLGPVEWVGALALSAMLVVLLLAYSPRAALWFGVAAAVAVPPLLLIG